MRNSRESCRRRSNASGIRRERSISSAAAAISGASSRARAIGSGRWMFICHLGSCRLLPPNAGALSTVSRIGARLDWGHGTLCLNSRGKRRMTTTVGVMAAAFKDAGTPFIVGHPGGESVELMEAGRQRQMRFLLMKQEVAGAMLAATWGEITGSPGVCLSTRGPGAANMVNGVAHALLDRAPLIAITDAYSRPTYEIGLRQRIDQLAVYAPLVKWSTTIDAKTVSQQVRRAMRTATATPPGPVHFEFPQRSEEHTSELQSRGL